uniref:Uncharacterized protein n=1 Tax=Anguilla anguilla TaxID=7936 RepID=A0A0E9WV30_ANGAN
MVQPVILDPFPCENLKVACCFRPALHVTTCINLAVLANNSDVTRLTESA